MTARARAAIQEADTVIGYVTYIRLVADLLDGKEIIRKSMTEELDRAIEALARAREGKKVALISSGDAGVYGMGGPTFEVLMQAGWTPPEVTVETDEAGNTRVSLKADVQLGGRTVSLQGEGTGPVDAFVAGLNATGLAQVRVMDYREHAIGGVGTHPYAAARHEKRDDKPDERDHKGVQNNILPGVVAHIQTDIALIPQKLDLSLVIGQHSFGILRAQYNAVALCHGVQLLQLRGIEHVNILRLPRVEPQNP